MKILPIYNSGFVSTITSWYYSECQEDLRLRVGPVLTFRILFDHRSGKTRLFEGFNYEK